MGDWIEAGERAPAFSLRADDGSQVRLGDLKGEPVVLYFYPRDDTPGCTREACAFRDQQSRAQEARRPAAGDQRRHRREPRQVPRQIPAQFSPALGPGPRRRRKIRRLAREEHVRQKVDGHPAEHVSDRRGRQSGQGVEGSQGRRPRRAGVGGTSGVGLERFALFCAQDAKEQRAPRGENSPRRHDGHDADHSISLLCVLCPLASLRALARAEGERTATRRELWNIGTRLENTIHRSKNRHFWHTRLAGNPATQASFRLAA